MYNSGIGYLKKTPNHIGNELGRDTSIAGSLLCTRQDTGRCLAALTAGGPPYETMEPYTTLPLLPILQRGLVAGRRMEGVVKGWIGKATLASDGLYTV